MQYSYIFFQFQSKVTLTGSLMDDGCMVEMDQTVIELWLDVWARSLTTNGNGET